MRTSPGIAVALSTGFRLATAAPLEIRDESAHLWVTTYPAAEGQSGKVVTLKLDQAGLSSVSESDACGGYPSWLTQAGEVLYCVDEAWGADSGSLSALQIGGDLGLTQLSSAQTIGGPVSTEIYGKDGRGLAVAD